MAAHLVSDEIGKHGLDLTDRGIFLQLDGIEVAMLGFGIAGMIVGRGARNQWRRNGGKALTKRPSADVWSGRFHRSDSSGPKRSRSETVRRTPGT